MHHAACHTAQLLGPATRLWDPYLSPQAIHTPALALTVSVCCSQSCWSEVCLPAISVKCHIYARYLLCVCGVSLHACQETGLLSMQCRDGLHLNLCRVWNVQSIQVKRSAEMITIIMQAVRMLKSSASKLLCTLYWLHTMYHTACLPHGILSVCLISAVRTQRQASMQADSQRQTARQTNRRHATDARADVLMRTE